MKVGDVYSSFLSADDLTLEPIDTVILGVDVERIDDKPKIVVTLRGVAKKWVVNRTNAALLSDAYGDDTDGWLDQPVRLERGRTRFMGKAVPCVSCHVPAPEAGKGGNADA